MEEIHEILKDLVLSKIKEAEKTSGSIATYGIIRNASGIFSISIYWKGRIKKGESSRITFELDRNFETSLTAFKVLEEILLESHDENIIDKLKKQKNTRINKGNF